jgi:predicted RNA-binding protein with PUA-like domain
MSFWLMKSEPEVFSIDDLRRVKRTGWDSVRNYQARNYMREGMQVGDLAFFYHSNSEPSGIAGLMKIIGVGLVDPTQFDKKSEVFDKAASKEAPRWHMAQVEFVEAFSDIVSLQALKAHKSLTGLLVLQKGQRLSVQPVEASHFSLVCKLAGATTQQ